MTTMEQTIDTTTTEARTFRVTINHDPDTERPDQYGIARLVSFNSRHINYTHPDEILACVAEIQDPEGLRDVCGLSPEYHDEDSPPLKVDIPDNMFPPHVGFAPHEYQRDPDILAILSYGEHGLCRWWVADGGHGTFGHWDSVQVAGVLVWNATEGADRAWWDGLTEETQRDYLNSLTEEYTAWANGETYLYEVEIKSPRNPCGECGRGFDEWEYIDSCGGFIGSDYTLETIAEVLDGEGFRIGIDRVKVKGEGSAWIDQGDIERAIGKVRETAHTVTNV